MQRARIVIGTVPLSVGLTTAGDVADADAAVALTGVREVTAIERVRMMSVLDAKPTFDREQKSPKGHSRPGRA